MKKNAFALILLVSVILVLQIIVGTGVVSEQLLPSPLKLFETFWNEKDLLFVTVQETGLSVIVAFGLAVICATALAWILHLNDFLARGIFPIAIFFQTVPIIAIAPLLVIYFGFGRPTVVVASAIVSFFPILAAWMVGLKRVPVLKYELFKNLRTNQWKVLSRLEIPTAMPFVLSGLRSAAGLAVVGAVTGEFVAGGGLGGLIDSARLQQRLDLVFCGLILLAVLGLVLIQIIDFFFQWRFKKYLFDT